MKCKLCKKLFKGRSDKKFCTIRCKSKYHKLLAGTTDVATSKIDKILHRNRSILLEIIGKKKVYAKVSKDLLDAKNFNYTYLTSYHLNTRNKMINYVYDFSWAIFSDNQIAIRRLKTFKE